MAELDFVFDAIDHRVALISGRLGNSGHLVYDNLPMMEIETDRSVGADA